MASGSKPEAEDDKSVKRYNSILSIIDKRLVPDEGARKARGEIFTPLSLVREMILGLRKSALEKGHNEAWGFDEEADTFYEDDEKDRLGGIPLSVLRDPTKKWLDPANGIGNFPVIVFYILDYQIGNHGPPEFRGAANKTKRRKHIVKNMLYMIELNKGNVNTSRKIFEKLAPGVSSNICCADTLKITHIKLKEVFGIDRFDIIMGNPPFNKGGVTKGGGALWPYFVRKAFELVKENGYICFVHPPGWRKFYDTEDRDNQGTLWYTVREKKWNLDYINVSDLPPKHFPIVDYYIIHAANTNKPTQYNSSFMGITDFGESTLDYPFIPNMLNNEVMGILKKLFKAKGEPIYIIRNQSFQPSKADEGKSGTPHYHFTDKSGEKHIYNKQYTTIPEYINKDKVLLTFSNGYEKGRLLAFYSNGNYGTTGSTMYMLTESKAHGDKLVRFFNSDIITFLMKITQYSASPNHKNEFKILNQLEVPDSLDYDLTAKEEELIKKVVDAKDKDVPCPSDKERLPGTRRCVKKCIPPKIRNEQGKCVNPPGAKSKRAVKGGAFNKTRRASR
jgi:hypothetical protein